MEKELAIDLKNGLQLYAEQNLDQGGTCRIDIDHTLQRVLDTSKTT